MANKRKTSKPATAVVYKELSNVEYGKKLRAAGIAKHNERDRQKAIKAAKELLGKVIRL